MKIYIQFNIARITFFDRYINYNAIKCLMTPNIYIYRSLITIIVQFDRHVSNFF